MKKVIVEKYRLLSFDLIKLLAIFFVIWGHSISGFLSTDSSDNAVFRILNSFHVALFMMISGFFSVSSMKLDAFHFVFKKFKQLIYPCFLWGLLLLICLYIIHLDNHILKFCLKEILTDLYWYSDFWFLKSCFICYCLLYLGIHSGLRNTYCFFLTILMSQLIPPFQVSFMYPCFIIGFEIKQNSKFLEFVKFYTPYIWCCFIIMLIFWDKTAWGNSHGFSFDFFLSGVNNFLNVLFFRLYRLFIGVMGALSFMGLAINISNTKLHDKYVANICLWGSYTLEIYILQAIVFERLLFNFVKFDMMNIYIFNFVFSPTISFIILLVCIFILEVLKKSKGMMLFLFGRN